MKRILGVLLAMLLIIQFAYAETLPEWDDETTFLYGMSIRQRNGEPLERPAIGVETIRNGIEVEIKNGMPYPDRGLLLFVMNGRIQPFCLGDRKEQFHEFSIGANASIKFIVTFEDLDLSDENELQYLHVIQIGLLDKDPVDGYDYNDIYTNGCSLPIAVKEGKSVIRENALDPIPISSQIYDDMMLNGSIICFNTKTDDEHIYIRSCIEDLNFPYQLEVTAVAPPKMLSFLLIVDGEPWQYEAGLYSGFAETGHALWASYDLSTLQAGTHQVCGILVPMNETMDFSIATPKLSLTIREQGETP